MTASLDRPADQSPLRFGEGGLIPAVIQDAESDAVLMVGFMNAEALARTRTTGRVHFWSRSRQTIWRKGETSGHEQIVEEIRVNCELNSLLVRVRQLGAVCHDGYPSCFYRRLEPDDALTMVLERAFDPEMVYASSLSAAELSPSNEAELKRTCRLQFGAYAYLNVNDLSAESGTSARLHDPSAPLASRLAGELDELAGALDGSHRHRDLPNDVVLEGSQVVYWATLVALRAGATWERLRTDRALLTGEPDLPIETAAALLRAEATAWRGLATRGQDVVASSQAALALVGQACASVGISPLVLVTSDLAELRARPYLTAYFLASSSNLGTMT
jgi:phosphoribosyl-AMP cyclohydrolase